MYVLCSKRAVKISQTVPPIHHQTHPNQPPEFTKTTYRPNLPPIRRDAATAIAQRRKKTWTPLHFCISQACPGNKSPPVLTYTNKNIFLRPVQPTPSPGTIQHPWYSPTQTRLDFWGFSDQPPTNQTQLPLPPCYVSPMPTPNQCNL